jgi:hypothetical protein
MKKFALILYIAVCSLIPEKLSAQQKDPDLVQVSGLVLTADSLNVLPLVSVRIKNTGRGTYTDPGGFFSIVMKKTDTLVFSYIGYKTVEYLIPASATAHRFSIIQVMVDSTMYLPETVIRAWPTPEEFNYYFVKANIPDDYYYRSRYNTRREGLAITPGNINIDASDNVRATMNEQYYRSYYNGQLVPQRLFDPFAWQEFYNSWKKGDLKSKP